MAGSRPRRGPAPIASFDHDVSDEVRQAVRIARGAPLRPGPAVADDAPRVCPQSSPEAKRALELPEIREHGGGAAGPLLRAPAAPRIDISRASSSSHHDSRDSSPEMALFAGGGDAAGDGGGGLGFREDGALELRSSTEELAFLEGAPGGPPPPPPAPRRASRKDSQCSEAALLAVSGRTSRLSSVGSQCSAHSALSGLGRLSRLSVASAASGASALSRSPSPHRMLLETSFCGPKPIETDADACGAAVEERLLEMAKLESPPADARDRREVRTEATVERVPRSAPAPPPASAPAPALSPPPPAAPPPAPAVAPDKQRKEDTNSRARAEERRARPKQRRDRTEPEVYSSKNRSKDIIRIKLKPDEDYDDDDNDEEEGCSAAAARPNALVRASSPRRSPSPGPVAGVSRKSSFCSLFKSRETIASPDSPLDALRRKKSLTEGRSRSKSRDRAVTPSSAGKIRGSVLSLFRVPRRSAASPSPSSRAASPGPPPAAVPPASRADHLKYYEEARDGIIHIPLRTPSDERPEERSEERIDRRARPSQAENRPRRRSAEPAEERGGGPRPTSAPQPSRPPKRTVLPDGSIIIPLRSPTDSAAPGPAPESPARRVSSPPEAPAEATPAPRSPPPPPEPQLPPPPSVGERKHDPLPGADQGRPRRKERLVFTTHVGSTEQVFTTQLSITKTPSVTSEISESFPSFPEDARSPILRDTRIGTSPAPSPDGPGGDGSGAAAKETAGTAAATAPGSAAGSPCGTPQSARDSSGSEASSGGAAARGCETEARGLVVQESFEDELPYVPTTLPLERSLALPMVPVRDRAAARHSTGQSATRLRSGGPGRRPHSDDTFLDSERRAAPRELDAAAGRAARPGRAGAPARGRGAAGRQAAHPPAAAASRRLVGVGVVGPSGPSADGARAHPQRRRSVAAGRRAAARGGRG